MDEFLAFILGIAVAMSVVCLVPDFELKEFKNQAVEYGYMERVITKGDAVVYRWKNIDKQP